MSPSPRGIDPLVTEVALKGVPGVSEAWVWWDNDELKAHVIVDDDARLTPRDLQLECMERLGLHQTPRRILLEAQRLLAA